MTQALKTQVLGTGTGGYVVGIVAALGLAGALVAQPAHACSLPLGYTPPPPSEIAARTILNADIVATGVVTISEYITFPDDRTGEDLDGQRVAIEVAHALRGNLTGTVSLEGPMSFNSCGGYLIRDTFIHGLTRGGEVVMVGEARPDGPAILHIYPVETPVGTAILNSLQSSTQ